MKPSTSNVRSKFFQQPSLDDEASDSEEVKAVNVSRVSNAKTAPQKKVSQMGLNRFETQDDYMYDQNEKLDLAKVILQKQRSAALQPLRVQTLNIVKV